MTEPTIAMKAAIPVLFVRDVAASAAHYRERLGFNVDFLYGAPAFYGAVSRGQACLHLRAVGAPNFTELAAREPSLVLATVEVSDVGALYRELTARGAAFTQPLQSQVWGGTDFHVRDPDGNIISFVTFPAP